jgi:hypothetical protein
LNRFETTLLVDATPQNNVLCRFIGSTKATQN